MFTDVHLLAAAFCNKERTRYALDKLKLTKDGRAIASNGMTGIIVGPVPLPDKHEMKNDLYVYKEDAQRVLDALKKRREDKVGWVRQFDINEIDDKEYKVTQPGLTICFVHDENENFPDVEEAVETVSPKKKEDCGSAYVSIDRLKEIIDQLQQMTESNASVEMFLAGKSEGKKAALRLEAEGKNGEKIEVTLMQVERYTG